MAVTTSYALQNIKSEFISVRSALEINANERDPSLVTLANGGFAVAFEWENNVDPTHTRMMLERYTIDGTVVPGPSSGSTIFDASTPGQIKIDPAITQLTDGRILNTWTQTGSGIRYSMVDPTNGTVTTTDTLLPGTDATNSLSDVVALAGGGFAVVMQDNISAADQDADLRIYTAAGVPVISRALGANSDFDEQAPAIAALNNGNIVVAYEKELAEGSDTFGMAVEIYTSAGVAVLAPFTFDTVGNQNRKPDVVALHDGGFAVVYQDDGWGEGEPGLTIAFFTAAGVLRDTERVDISAVTDLDHAVTVLANGFVVVTWTNGDGGTTGDIRSALFDPASMTRLESFVGIETQSGVQLHASAVGLANGTFVTAWTDANLGITDGNTDPHGTHISLQIDAYARTLISDGASDRMIGDALIDNMLGNGGADILIGRGGNDLVAGGAGDDFFVLGLGDGADTIANFVPGAGTEDKVVLPTFANAQTFDAVIALATQVGADTVINFGNGDTLTLQNVTKTNLHADDFLFDMFQVTSLALNSFGASAAAGGWANNNQYPRTAADVNGDGRADLVGFGDTGVYVALADVNGAFQNLTFAINSFGFSAAGGSWSTNDQYPRTLGDVNGDGRADVIGFGDTGTFVALGNANGTFQSPGFALNSFGYSAAGGGWTTNNQYPRTVGDVNGDGRADLIGFGDTGVYVALGNTNGTFQNPIFAINSFGFSAAGGGWSNSNQYPRTAGDVNGDGRADLIGFGDTGVYVALGNANGTFQSPILAINSFGFSPAGGGWTSNNQYPRTLGDVNGDGRADIVGFGDTGVFISLGKADGTFAAPVADLASFGPNAGGWTSNDQYLRTLGDANGDGSDDVIGFGDAGVFVALANDFVV